MGSGASTLKEQGLANYGQQTEPWCLKNKRLGLPWLLSDKKKNLPANAGDVGSIPGPARPHRPWSNQTCAPQLSGLCSRAWRHNYKAHLPQLPKPAARHRPRSQQEKPPHRNQRAAPTCHNYGKLVQQWRPGTKNKIPQKNKRFIGTEPRSFVYTSLAAFTLNSRVE